MNEQEQKTVRRTVKVVAEKGSIIGAWSLTCADCPLLPHLKALGEKPRDCAYGIQTRVQGAVTLGTCQHYEKESVKADGKKLTIGCQKGEA